MIRKAYLFLFLISSLLPLGAVLSVGTGQQKSTQANATLSAEGVELFEKKIRSVLDRRCGSWRPSRSHSFHEERIYPLVALTIEAVGEALLLAAKAGADPAKVRRRFGGGFAASHILEVHGERMLKRAFDPGFRIELHQKDLNLALATAREIGVALPNTAIAQQRFNACVVQGGRAWDHSAMVRALERMADLEIGLGEKTKPGA